MFKVNVDSSEITSMISKMKFIIDQKYNTETNEIEYYSEGQFISKNDEDAKIQYLKESILQGKDIYDIGLEREEVNRLTSKDDFLSKIVDTEIKEMIGQRHD